MRRRHFLQLAGSAAAGAMVAQATGVAVTGILVKSPAHDTVSVTNRIALLEPERWLGVSGWIASDVIHVMLEKQPAAPWSYPEIAFTRLEPGRRYRLRMMNATPAAIAVHLPSHRLHLAHYSVVEADLIAGAQTLV